MLLKHFPVEAIVKKAVADGQLLVSERIAIVVLTLADRTALAGDLHWIFAVDRRTGDVLASQPAA